MPKFRLTPEQLRFMDTFGYLHFPGFLNDCIDQIIEAFERVWVDLNVDHPETTTHLHRAIHRCKANTLVRSSTMTGLMASLPVC